jgi:hypothetical protein
MIYLTINSVKLLKNLIKYYNEFPFIIIFNYYKIITIIK